MVDISSKDIVRREAIAEGIIKLRKETIERIRKNEVEKGNPLQISQISGIQSAKLTPLLIPLCHPILIENVSVDFEVKDDFIKVRAKVIAQAKTGVEMEALTVCLIALLNIWDVVKKYEKNEEGQYPYTEIISVKIVKKVKQ